MKKIKITIEGMHCSSCGNNVERSLKTIKEVKSVSANVLTNKTIIEAEDSISREEIIKAVSKTGFKITNFEGV